MRKRPTIRDVASLAGVSHQTVSRFLKNNGGLRPETESRIKSAVDALGYRPSLVAQSLKSPVKGRLAILLPAIAYNPVRVLAGAREEAHAAGFSLDILSPEGGVQGRTERLWELADSGLVEGVLSIAPLQPDALTNIPGHIAVVVADEFDEDMRGTQTLIDATAVAELITGLADMGHRRFFHVAGAQSFPSARARKRTYLQTVAALGLESVGVLDGDFTAESGIRAVHSFDSSPPTAIIAANDLVAAGVLRGAYERGWSVPNQFSVTGWDNNDVSQFVPPSLTTVHVDLERVGKLAMARLIAALRGEEAPQLTTSINRVIWRDSTAPPPQL